MILTFVHDGPLFKGDDGRYYEFAYHNLLERYKDLADEIYFLIRTDVITTENKFTPVPEEIKVVSVPNIKGIGNLIRNKKKATAIIEQQIRKSDIVVLRTQSSIAQIAEGFVKKYNKPYIIECVGCSWDAYWNHSLLGKLVAPYMEYKTRSAIARAKYVYYVTNEFLQKKYPAPHAKTIACSNVVIQKAKVETFEKRLKKIECLEKGCGIVLGTAASIETKYKGQQFVIKAMKILEKKGFKIKYLLAGGQNSSALSRNHLQILAEKINVQQNVAFCGNLSKEKMSEFYDNIDIYIQPSKQEGLPRSVIEAMSHGCPVLGSNIAGIPELIAKECLFRKGNVTSIAKKIEEMIFSDLSVYARSNFEKSLEYEYSILNKRRKDFYTVFLKDNNLQK